MNENDRAPFEAPPPVESGQTDEDRMATMPAESREMEDARTYRRRKRSLFWPLALIAVGAILLLHNFDLLPSLSWGEMARYWPVLMIAMGVAVLSGRRWPWLGALLGVAAVAIAMMAFLGGMGLWTDWSGMGPLIVDDPTQHVLDVSAEGATEAKVTLDLNRFGADVYALENGDNVIEAEVYTLGELRNDVIGTETSRTITLGEVSSPAGFFSWNGNQQAFRWQIGLSPDVALDLNVDGSSGSVNLDLDSLDLTDLTLDVGSGATLVTLPEGPVSLRVEGGSGSLALSGEGAVAATGALDLSSGSSRLSFGPGSELDLDMDMGSGGSNVTLGDDTSGEVRITGASGSLVVNVAPGTPVRVEVHDSGSGSVTVPSELDQISSGDGDEGVWQSAMYDGVTQRVLVNIRSVGSGSIRVSYSE